MSLGVPNDALIDFTAIGKSLVTAVDQDAARLILGVGSADSPAFDDIVILDDAAIGDTLTVGKKVVIGATQPVGTTVLAFRDSVGNVHGMDVAVNYNATNNRQLVFRDSNADNTIARFRITLAGGDVQLDGTDGTGAYKGIALGTNGTEWRYEPLYPRLRASAGNVTQLIVTTTGAEIPKILTLGQGTTVTNPSLQLRDTVGTAAGVDIGVNYNQSGNRQAFMRGTGEAGGQLAFMFSGGNPLIYGLTADGSGGQNIALGTATSWILPGSTGTTQLGTNSIAWGPYFGTTLTLSGSVNAVSWLARTTGATATAYNDSGKWRVHMGSDVFWTDVNSHVFVTGTGEFRWNGRSRIRSPSDGVVHILNNAENGWATVQCGAMSVQGNIDVVGLVRPITDSQQDLGSYEPPYNYRWRDVWVGRNVNIAETTNAGGITAPGVRFTNGATVIAHLGGTDFVGPGQTATSWGCNRVNANGSVAHLSYPARVGSMLTLYQDGLYFDQFATNSLTQLRAFVVDRSTASASCNSGSVAHAYSLQLDGVLWGPNDFNILGGTQRVLIGTAAGSRNISATTTGTVIGATVQNETPSGNELFVNTTLRVSGAGTLGSVTVNHGASGTAKIVSAYSGYTGFTSGGGLELNDYFGNNAYGLCISNAGVFTIQNKASSYQFTVGPNCDAAARTFTAAGSVFQPGFLVDTVAGLYKIGTNIVGMGCNQTEVQRWSVGSTSITGDITIAQNYGLIGTPGDNPVRLIRYAANAFQIDNGSGGAGHLNVVGNLTAGTGTFGTGLTNTPALTVADFQFADGGTINVQSRRLFIRPATWGVGTRLCLYGVDGSGSQFVHNSIEFANNGGGAQWTSIQKYGEFACGYDTNHDMVWSLAETIAAGWGSVGNFREVMRLSKAGSLTVIGSLTTSGTFYAANGYVTTPTYSFTNDTNTGWYSYSADIMAAAAGGKIAAQVDAYNLAGASNYCEAGTSLRAHNLAASGMFSLPNNTTLQGAAGSGYGTGSTGVLYTTYAALTGRLFLGSGSGEYLQTGIDNATATIEMRLNGTAYLTLSRYNGGMATINGAVMSTGNAFYLNNTSNGLTNAGGWSIVQGQNGAMLQHGSGPSARFFVTSLMNYSGSGVGPAGYSHAAGLTASAHLIVGHMTDAYWGINGTPATGQIHANSISLGWSPNPWQGTGVLLSGVSDSVLTNGTGYLSFKMGNGNYTAGFAILDSSWNKALSVSQHAGYGTLGRVGVGNVGVTNTDYVGALTVKNTYGATVPGIVIVGHASQSGNAIDYQNSAGTSLFSVSSDGSVTAAGMNGIRLTGGSQPWRASVGTNALWFTNQTTGNTPFILDTGNVYVYNTLTVGAGGTGTIYVGSTANEIWSQYGYLNLKNTGGNGVTIQDGTGTERIKVSGTTINLNGNTYTGHLKVIGNAGNTYDIGENTYRFRDGYFAGTLYSSSFSGASLSVTTGVSSSGYIIAYGNTVGLNYNGAAIRLVGSQGMVWGASLDSAWRTRLYESAAGTLTVDNGAGGAATLAVTGTLQATSSDGAINKFTTYGQLELGFGATYPAIFFGGRDTASRPKLSVSGTNLQWMLTDESAFAPIMGSEVVARTMSALTARLTTFSGYIGTVDVSEDGTNYAARMKADEGLKLGVNRMIKFGPNAAVGSEDVGICRNSAGLLEINNSTFGTYRDLRLRNIEVVGDIGIAESLTFTKVNDGNTGTAKTINWSAGNRHEATLTGNVTFTFTAPAGAASLILLIKQDATGGRTITWPATVKWPGGVAPTPTSAANSIDLYTFYYDGTNYYGAVGQNYS